MKDWRTTKACYEVHEVARGRNEVYTLYMTGNEITSYCYLKNQNYGYVEGLGGDKTYSCWAIIMVY